MQRNCLLITVVFMIRLSKGYSNQRYCLVIPNIYDSSSELLCFLKYVFPMCMEILYAKNLFNRTSQNLTNANLPT